MRCRAAGRARTREGKNDSVSTNRQQIAGMAIWVMGGDDPAFWPETASQMGRP
jgi:hypothetical protein